VPYKAVGLDAMNPYRFDALSGIERRQGLTGVHSPVVFMLHKWAKNSVPKNSDPKNAVSSLL